MSERLTDKDSRILWEAIGAQSASVVTVRAVERIVEAHVAEALAPVYALAEDVWRVAPCGCGHRADLHTNPVYPDEVPICRGHALCGCDWSFVRIVQHRLRAALHPDTMPGGPVVSEQHTSEGDAPVVWHDEAQRFHDLGILDPPTFCACDDCLRAPAAALRAAAGTPTRDTTEEETP